MSQNISILSLGSDQQVIVRTPPRFQKPYDPWMFQWQVIPRFAEELSRKDVGSADGAFGHGFNLTADMHRRGIGVRHMGLLRDMFWRPLHGTVDLSFNSNRVRTKTDMRLQLRRGDQVSDMGNVRETRTSNMGYRIVQERARRTPYNFFQIAVNVVPTDFVEVNAYS